MKYLLSLSTADFTLASMIIFSISIYSLILSPSLALIFLHLLSKFSLISCTLCENEYWFTLRSSLIVLKQFQVCLFEILNKMIHSHCQKPCFAISLKSVCPTSSLCTAYPPPFPHPVALNQGLVNVTKPGQWGALPVFMGTVNQKQLYIFKWLKRSKRRIFFQM